MLVPFEEYLEKHFVGKWIHFTCNCLVALDVSGRCVSVEKRSNEWVFTIDYGGKQIQVGSNTPNLQIEVS